jgi:hypothetical protein
MPTIVDTYIKDGETINVYESGAHYNVTRKHLVRAPESAMITKENVGRFKERLAEKKREAVARGAARVLERSGDWDKPNALDVADALAEAVMEKAMDPTNPKQVDAARYLMTEMGLAESQTKTSEDAQQFASLADAAGQLVAFLRQIHGETLNADVIDVPALTDGEQ